MATETERFQSKFRRENRTTTAGRRRIFEDGAERENSRTSGRSSNDRTESASITQKMNNINLKDDKVKNDSDQEDTKPEREEDEEEEQSTAKKSHKKAGSSATSRKRNQRKNLREKRRSTGVVIMPGAAVVATDEEERTVQENTVRNMDAGSSAVSSVEVHTVADNDHDMVEILKQEIEEWKEKYAKATREIDTLKTDLQRYKDENGALLRVVGNFTSAGRK